MGLRAGPTRLTFHRDLYFDTPEGDLRRRGVRCRVRFEVEDRRTLVLDVPGMARAESAVKELEPSLMFSSDVEPEVRDFLGHNNLPHLVKPFEVADLIAQARRLLQKTHAVAAS